MKNFRIGVIFLILFCFFRPLALINVNIAFGGLNAFELFAIVISYVLLFAIALYIRKIKFDLISVSILLFCAYCFMSISWGSELRTIAQVTLPFILFFAIRLMIGKPKEIKFLLTALIIAYCFLLVGSLYQIIQETSISFVEPITGIERHAGLFKRIKPFSFSLFLFSVFFYFQVIIYQLNNRQIKWGLFILLIISIFCLFKTYSRTTYIGLAIFWAISLWGHNKKYFSVVLILSLVLGFIYFANLEQIFIKTPKFDFNTATSGRIFLWEHNINLFLESDFDKKLLGHGLGVVSSSVFGTRHEIWASHNDYLQVLMATGTIGFVLYILIYLILLKDVYLSNIDKSKKFFYYGVIISIIVMNFASGVTLLQVGISQQFWMVMGFFYIYRDLKKTPSIRNRFL
jgi:O-antigen ligase